jgi:hypothetical protein
VIGVTVVFSLFDQLLTGLIPLLTDIAPWKIRGIVAVPFLIVLGFQISALYCGMVRDADWWFEDDLPKRRRRH